MHGEVPSRHTNKPILSRTCNMIAIYIYSMMDRVGKLTFDVRLCTYFHVKSRIAHVAQASHVHFFASFFGIITIKCVDCSQVSTLKPMCGVCTRCLLLRLSSTFRCWTTASACSTIRWRCKGRPIVFPGIRSRIVFVVK